MAGSWAPALLPPSASRSSVLSRGAVAEDAYFLARVSARAVSFGAYQHVRASDISHMGRVAARTRRTPSLSQSYSPMDQTYPPTHMAKIRT